MKVSPLKKIIFTTYLVFILAGLFIPTIHIVAQTDSPYHLLAPIGQLTDFNQRQKNPLGNYLNIMITIIIGFSAVLAVVMIFMGGIEYMTSEVISSKEHGKERIRNAIFGLLLAFGSYLILNTINPDLLKTDLASLKDVDLELSGSINSFVIKPSGSCAVATSGNCAPNNLSIFESSASDASRICMVESRGDATVGSNYDKCRNNTVFSYGLFQINLIAHGSIIDNGSCTDLFTLEDGGAILGNNYIVLNSDKTFNHYDCKLKSGAQDKYNNCVAKLKNPQTNINIAKYLFLTYSRPHAFNSWWYSDYPRCGNNVSVW